MKKETQTAKRETGGKSKERLKKGKAKGRFILHPLDPAHGTDVFHPKAVCPFLSPPRLIVTSHFVPMRIPSFLSTRDRPFTSLPKKFRVLGGRLLVPTPFKPLKVCGRGYIFFGHFCVFVLLCLFFFSLSKVRALFSLLFVFPPHFLSYCSCCLLS